MLLIPLKITELIYPGFPVDDHAEYALFPRQPVVVIQNWISHQSTRFIVSVGVTIVVPVDACILAHN